jgi:hypothetical protein
MNGNIKIFNMLVEGETIGFDTPYNSNWNFMARDFEQIIDTLQQENARLKEFKKEHEIMKKILIEKGLWETLLNDDRFLEYLREEN